MVSQIRCQLVKNPISQRRSLDPGEASYSIATKRLRLRGEAGIPALTARPAPTGTPRLGHRHTRPPTGQARHQGDPAAEVRPRAAHELPQNWPLADLGVESGEIPACHHKLGRNSLSRTSRHTRSASLTGPILPQPGHGMRVGAHRTRVGRHCNVSGATTQVWSRRVSP